jgi:selenocysteine-specific elongation factor
MYIDRLFNVKGVGSVVTGSVLSGTINIGDNVFLQPLINKELKVKAIQRHGKDIKTAEAGDRAALNLSGLKKEDFKRGMIISNTILETSNMLDVSINLFENAKELKLWSTVLFHAGTYESQARIHLLDTDSLKAGQKAIAQIHLEKPGIFFNKDRFIIRNTSGDKTIAGGIIIDNKPLHHKKRPPKLIDRLTSLLKNIENNDKAGNIIDLELRKEQAPMKIDELAQKINTPAEKVIEIINNNSNFLIYDNNKFKFILLQEYENKIINFIIDELKKYHEKYKILEEGVSINYFTGKLNAGKNTILKSYIDLVLNKLAKENKLKKVSGTWALSEHKAELSEKDKEYINFLKNIFLNYKLQKPVIHDIETKSREKGISKDTLKTLLKYLENTNFLIRYNQDYIASDIVSEVEKSLTK